MKSMHRALSELETNNKSAMPSTVKYGMHKFVEIRRKALTLLKPYIIHEEG